jgi:hypothetical protein
MSHDNNYHFLWFARLISCHIPSDLPHVRYLSKSIFVESFACELTINELFLKVLNTNVISIMLALLILELIMSENVCIIVDTINEFF